MERIKKMFFLFFIQCWLGNGHKGQQAHPILKLEGAAVQLPPQNHVEELGDFQTPWEIRKGLNHRRTPLPGNPKCFFWPQSNRNSMEGFSVDYIDKTTAKLWLLRSIMSPHIHLTGFTSALHHPLPFLQPHELTCRAVKVAKLGLRELWMSCLYACLHGINARMKFIHQRVDHKATIALGLVWFRALEGEIGRETETQKWLHLFQYVQSCLKHSLASGCTKMLKIIWNTTKDQVLNRSVAVASTIVLLIEAVVGCAAKV